MPNLIWFREDLRLEDNHALWQACTTAKDGVIALYLINPSEWQSHNMSGNRVDFLLRTLWHFSGELNQLHIPLIIEVVSPEKTPDKVILHLTKKFKIKNVYFNVQYELDELRRDKSITEILESHQIKVAALHDQTILPPGVVLTQSGKQHTIFTPFKKRWLEIIKKRGLPEVLPKPKPQAELILEPSRVPNKIEGFTPLVDPKWWPAGEEYAMKSLKNFIANKIGSYNTNRDFPALDATSRLSPYLSIGSISARLCLQAAVKCNGGHLSSGKEGVCTWINELIWRDFYKNILASFPRVSMDLPFRLATQKIQWDNNEAYFEAWKQGRTGFPIVDAAMRQLLEEGWMHNRLRMIVAMFLTKDLLIDWRLGEKHFIEHLIDGDLAANNGGWQWAASTGTDAVPYFRIFNPWTQSAKFDPDAEFIKRYCPELQSIPAKLLHKPDGLDDKERKQLNYPAPIVDHELARKRTLDLWKKLI